MTETDALNWTEIEASLNSVGHADMGAVLSTETTARLIRDFEREDIYRSHIRMQRHGFGEGEYKYYAHPLPDPIRDLRRTL
ncbi:MAG: proline hydroxylase, partial [Pseudomonadota bacterium]